MLTVIVVVTQKRCESASKQDVLILQVSQVTGTDYINLFQSIQLKGSSGTLYREQKKFGDFKI